MNDEKVNYVIDMIKDMDIENKLKLAICMCDDYSHTNLVYDKKELYKYFDNLLKQINRIQHSKIKLHCIFSIV